MRKTLIIATLAVATLFTACKKQGEPISGNSIPKPPISKMTSSGFSFGQQETLVQQICDSIYPYNPATTKLSFYEHARRTNAVVNGLGIWGTSNPDTVASIIFNYSHSKGYLNTNGTIKPDSVLIPMMIANVSNESLRDALTYIHEHIDMAEDQESFQDMVTSTLGNVTGRDSITNIIIDTYEDVLFNAEIYCMGILMPPTIGEADALGMIAGANYFMETGGYYWSDGHGGTEPNNMLYWGFRFSVSFSQAVACNDPNAHP